MKIAVWHNLPSGGAKRALYNQVKELLARGHEIECWTPISSVRSYLPLEDLVPVHVINYPPPFSIIHKYMPKLLDLFQKGFCSVISLKSISRRCASQINNSHFDVLYSANCRYQAVPPIARYIKIPSVLYSQEPYRRFYEPRLCDPWLKSDDPRNPVPKTVKPIYHKVKRMKEEQLNARAFNKVLVNSNYSKNKINKAYGVTPEVCYLGVDTNIFRNTGSPRENFILGVGSIQPHKRIDLAIKSVSLLNGKKYPLVWIGNLSSGSYVRYLKKLARSLSVDFQLKIMVSDRELIDYMNRALIMINTAKFEPFGLALLEANACGAPAVAVAEGGVRETIKPGINGLLVESTDPIEIANTMQGLFDDQHFLDEITRKSPLYVQENWSWTKSVDQLEKNLQEIASSNFIL